MYRLSSIIGFVLVFVQVLAQSPHGDSFQVNCATCHTPSTWAINIDTFQFDHDTTSFALEGVHLVIDCKTCHTSLVFDEAPSQCIDCHQDIHSMSVGNDCARCHTAQNWLVDNIPEIHEENGFPLMGAHGNLSCVDCHLSETNLRFDRVGNDCISCHQEDYANTISPNHITSNFSTNCSDCHNPLYNGWETDNIGSHDFFPLTKGHDIQDCTQCHNPNDYSDITSDCVSCHTTDYENTANPNHQAANLSTDCVSCHTTDLNWQPASYLAHDEQHFPIYSGTHKGEWMDCIDCHLNPSDYSEFTCTTCHANPETDNVHNGIGGYLYVDNACLACHPNGDADIAVDHDANFFPIYSGTHEGEWSACIDCHTNPNNFAEFTCVTCHANPETNNQHTGITGYSYESNACLACHPTGDSDDTFDHDLTNFPLTGEHIGVDCLKCHADGFAGTSTACVDCHQTDFNASVNPNHMALNIPTDCIACHTTEADWKPASFDIHNNYHPLNGAHAAIANDCAVCHNGDYNNTPNTCFGCHQSDYNTATPNHSASGFPTDCLQCHNESAWEPATFDHDDQYFPIYSGEHKNEWDACIDCHTNPNDYSAFSCINCHKHSNKNEVDKDHDEENNYQYISTECYRCHPDGRE